MRLVRPVLAGLLSTVLLAACQTAAPGWTYAPAPPPTEAPSPDPESPAPTNGNGESPAPTNGNGGNGELVEVSAVNIAFDPQSLSVPAGTPLQIEFANNDPGVPHNVEIRDPAGTSLWVGDVFNGVETRVYEAPALEAGAYVWICTVHPNMVIDVTAG